ncbi:aromatic amino acid transport family protein [Rickettsiales endosymbiont of Trichoplax sp. H2]|uniref:aromatic amino acid transport family protein n=1 Tax=Rickettsiales endosymbiont of Trichoplax sp. H2 TaxID=2021221 RepID=UPI0012B3A791|nr:aromatic amino acid transport family protein [Rickettsiales endosymbiont of Trichoplax sp. H2]MSO13319.1 Tyrosine-specific transport protein [Rickettsiales endosymbiont of Trichoplax sp. H2]
MFIKNKLVGAVFIVAGTSIGASMLALPMMASSLGALSTLALLIFIWFLGYYTATLALEINHFYKGAYSISELCKKSFNSKIWLLADFSIVSLFYSLLAAYISGIIDIAAINKFILTNYKSNYLGYLIVGVLIFCVVYNNKILDISNRLVFILKFTLFLILLYFLSLKIKFANINHFVSYIEINSQIFKAIPIFFTSFGFHGGIPFIMKYLDNDAINIKKSFFLGSLISFFIYLLWMFFSLGVLPKYGLTSFESIEHANNKLGCFINMLTNIADNSALHSVISMFSWLAIVTSFLGVGIGLYDYFFEKFKFKKNILKDQLLALLLTFFIPFVMAIFGENIFISALACAAISLSLLAIIFPTAIAFKIGIKSRLAVIITMFFGIVIIAIEVVNLLF